MKKCLFYSLLLFIVAGVDAATEDQCIQEKYQTASLRSEQNSVSITYLKPKIKDKVNSYGYISNIVICKDLRCKNLKYTPYHNPELKVIEQYNLARVQLESNITANVYLCNGTDRPCDSFVQFDVRAKNKPLYLPDETIVNLQEKKHY